MNIFDLGLQSATKVKDLIESYSSREIGIPDTSRWSGKDVPTKKQLSAALKNHVYDSKSRRSTVEGHWKAIQELYKIYRNEIPYASNQLGFRYAYENLVGKDVDSSDSLKLRNLGANLIPLDPVARISPVPAGVHPVFRTSQQGIAMFGHGSVKVVRAGIASGGYDDSTMPETLLYDTSTALSSVIRARHLEFLSEAIFENEGEQGLIMQLACLLKPKGRGGLDGKEFKSLFVMAFCEIIPLSRWPDDLRKKELKKYKHELFFPYLLRPLDPEYADGQLRSMLLLGEQVGDFEVRTPLSPGMVRKWSYENAKSRIRKKELDSFVLNSDPEYVCPHVSPVNAGRPKECGSKLKIGPGGYHIGHIFSQKWCDAYSIFQESVNHPDNLYLSCPSCNTSLNQGCPPKEMLKHINREKLTLGDLIRKGLLK